MAEDQRPEGEFKPAVNAGDFSEKKAAPDFSGEFTYAHVNELGQMGFDSDSLADMYDILADAATQQGFGDLADSLARRAKSPNPTISLDPDGIVMKLRGTMQEPEVDGTKEQVIRRRISFAIGYVIHDLVDLSSGRSTDDGTSTLADVRLDSAEDKLEMVALCQILAQNPHEVESTKPFVKLYGPDDETGQRYDIQTMPSVVAGYDLVLWRHGRAGRTTRTDQDMVKIFLRKEGSEIR